MTIIRRIIGLILLVCFVGGSGVAQDNLDAANALVDECLRLYDASQYQAALEPCTEALAALEGLDNVVITQSIVSNRLGVIHNQLGNSKEAIAFYQQSADLAHEIYEFTGERINLEAIGEIYQDLGVTQSAIAYYEQTIPLAIRTEDDDIRHTYHTIADLHAGHGQHAAAISNYEQALSISRKIEDWDSEDANLNDIAVVCDSIRQYDIAVQFYQQSLEINLNTDNSHSRAITLLNMANTYSNLEDYENAFHFAAQAAEIFGNEDNPISVAFSERIMGRAQRHLGNYDDALTLLNSALETFQAENDTFEIALTLNHIGHVYLMQENYDAALAMYEEAMALAENEGNALWASIYRGAIGRLYTRQGRYNEALDILNIALAGVESANDFVQIEIILDLIADVYEAQGLSEQADVYRLRAREYEPIVGDECSPFSLPETPAEDATGVPFTLNNNLDVRVCFVHIVPANSRNLGADWLASREVLAAGASQTWFFTAGTYDVTAIGCHGNTLRFEANVEINSPETLDTLLGVSQANSRFITALDQSAANEHEAALDNFLAVIPVFQQADMYAQEAISLSSVGIIYFDKGDLNFALDALNAAEELYRSENQELQAFATLSMMIKASITLIQGDFEAASQLFTQALADAKEIGDIQIVVLIQNRMALLHLYSGDMDLVTQTYQQSLELAIAEDNLSAQVDTLTLMAEVNRLQGEYELALEYANQALDIVNSGEELVSPQTTEALAQMVLGFTRIEQGYYFEGLEHLNIAYAITKEINAVLMLAEITNALGVGYMRIGNYQDAIQAFENSRDVAIQGNALFTQNQAIGNLGSMMTSLGYYGQGLNYLFDALARSRGVGNIPDEIATLTNIAATYLDQARYTLALDTYEDAFSLAEEAHMVSLQGMILDGMGTAYSQMGDRTTALQNYEAALEIHQRNNDIESEGITLGNMGEVYRQQGEYDLAESHLLEALQKHEQVFNLQGQAAVLNGLGSLFVNQGEYGPAIEAFTQSIEVAGRVNFRKQQSISLVYRGIAYELNGNPEAAIADYRAAIALSETVLNDAILDAAIASLSSDYQFKEPPFNRSPYQRLAVLLTQAGAPEQGLSFAERGRALLARTELTSGMIDFHNHASAADLEREAQLRLELTSAQNWLISLEQDKSNVPADILDNAREALQAAQNAYVLHLEQL